MQVLLQLKKNFFPVMHHSFVKILYPKYLFLIKYLSLITICFLIMDVNGFVIY